MGEQVLSRRRFVQATAGAAVAAGLVAWPASRALGAGRNGGTQNVVPPNKLGIQQFGFRDAVNRLDKSAKGYLGGPSFPEDPTDLGPLVDLPGGYQEVFEFLGSVGIKGFEFFQSTQNANEFSPARQPTAAEIRQYLDDAGMVAFGTHQFGVGNLDPITGNLTPAGETLYTFLATLGMRTMGFSGNLSNLNIVGNTTNPTTGAITYGFGDRCAHVTRIGEILASRGVSYFYHPEQDNYRFFDDPAHPELDTVHRIQYVLAHTNRAYFKLELDYLHNYSGRARFPIAPVRDANRVIVGTQPAPISVWDMIAADPKRLMGIHMKDGNVNPNFVRGNPAPNGGLTGEVGSPYAQTFLRTPTFTDAIVSGEGDLGRPYGPTGTQNDPDSRGFKYLIENLKGRYQNTTIDDSGRKVIIESDSGPGPTTGAAADPGRSLRHAKASAAAALAWRE
jgi:hypothetical protein